MDYITDTNRIDEKKLEAESQRREAYLQEQADTQLYLSNIQEQKNQEQAKLEEEQNKNSIGKELGNAVVGGLADAGSDVLTLPERAVDMFNGEMAEAGDDYKPDWDPLQPDQFETQTWWGGLIRGGVNLATLLIPVGGAFKLAGMGAKAAGVGLKLPGIIKGAAIGAGVDLVTAQSQGDNMSGMIVEHFPVMDNILGPLATKDTDHPLTKTLKNIVEGMGIGGVIDGLIMLRGLKKGGDDLVKALEDVEARNTSVEKQTIEKGRAELNEPGYRSHKNKAMSEPQQGSPNSKGSPMQIKEQLDTIDKDWSAERGSTDSGITPTMAERMAMGGADISDKEFKNLVKETVSDERYVKMMDEAKEQGVPMKELFKDSFQRAHRIINGINPEENADEFFERLFPKEYRARTGQRTVLDADGKARPLGDDFDIDYIRPEDVLTVDIAVGSMIKQIRDTGQVSGELLNFRDIVNGDGPLKTVADRIVTGMGLTRRSRYLSGLQLQRLSGPAGKKARKEVMAKLAKEQEQTLEALNMIMGMIRKGDDQKFVNAWVETLSKMNDVNNLEDLDKFMRTRHKGGEFNGKKDTGMVVKELQAVMINSILSGFKTPVRAFAGTALNAGLRNVSMIVGSALRLDGATFRTSVSSTSAMINALPESFQVFKSRVASNWSGDFSKMGNRFMEYERRMEDFTRMERWVETRGTDGDKWAFRFTKLIHGMNMNPVLTFNSNLMNASDVAFDVIMARSRARELAVREALDSGTKNINPKILKVAEQKFFSQVYDPDGTFKDDFIKQAAHESKLNAPLDGFGAKAEEMFNSAPWAKPFFLFARTGINGVAMTAKYTPGLNLVLKKQRAILSANANNLDDVMQYGIKNSEDLANEKALIAGRQTLGVGVTFLASQLYLGDNLHGNGPEDRKLRQSWIDGGWKPRSIKVGGTWVSLDAFEPFNTLLYAIADVGDNMQLMGPEWAEQNLLRIAAQATAGMASKSYMDGITQLVDLMAGEPHQVEKIIGSLLNNTVPMAGVRNDIGKLFNPGMKEINKHIGETIRNRNLLSEGIAYDGGLPDKYDLLNGEKLRNHHPIVRFFNMFSPIQFNLDHNSPGRDMLFNSNYDLRLSIMASPTGVSLAKHPQVRSLFAEAIGNQNLEKALDKLSQRSDVQASIRQMEKDLANGERQVDPRNYLHNRLIKQAFDKARKKAWAEISNQPQVLEVINANTGRVVRNDQATRDTSPIPLLIPTR